VAIPFSLEGSIAMPEKMFHRNLEGENIYNLQYIFIYTKRKRGREEERKEEKRERGERRWGC
jgi:hypothetical protein